MLRCLKVGPTIIKSTEVSEVFAVLIHDPHPFLPNDGLLAYVIAANLCIHVSHDGGDVHLVSIV